MLQKLIFIAIAFCFFWLIFGLIEHFFAAKPKKSFFRKGFIIDFSYFWFVILIIQPISKIAAFLTLIPIALIISHQPDPSPLIAGWGPIGSQPLWLQAIELLLLADFVSYWIHRFFHNKKLWPYHAIHHSSPELDWLSSVRTHPVNEILPAMIRVAIFVSMGFSLASLASVFSLLVFHGLLLHSNVNWDYGPLRGIIASPVFHRWHHSKNAKAIDTNFGGITPLWDRIFKTYYMPLDKNPHNFGVHDDVGNNILSHLIFPFRRKKKDI